MSEVLGLTLAEFHLEWGDLAQACDRLALLSSRDIGKSTVFSYAYPMWCAWTDPGQATYIFSNTEDQAKEFLDIIINGRDNLRGIGEIPLLSHLLPVTATRGAAREGKLTTKDVRFTNRSRIRALGYGVRVRGAHPKRVILDDVLNEEDMYSATVRDKRIKYYKGAIANMPPQNGQVVMVGTPQHVMDLLGFARNNKRFVFREYPGILHRDTPQARPLFPQRHTLAHLEAKLQEIGSIAFTREILVKPVSDESSLFPSDLFPPCFDAHIKLKPTRGEIAARKLTVFIGVDIARSANVGADFFVVFVIGVDPEGFHYVIDILRKKGMKFIDQQATIKNAARRYGADLIYIESNVMQRVWSEEMIRTTDLPVRPFEMTAQVKHPLDRGIPALRILFENQKFIIPRGDEYSVEQTNIWIDECNQMTFADGKVATVGEHDDTVMACFIASQAARAGGFSYDVGQDERSNGKAENGAADDLDEGEPEPDEDWQKVLMGSEDEDEDEDEGADLGDDLFPN